MIYDNPLGLQFTTTEVKGLFVRQTGGNSSARPAWGQLEQVPINRGGLKDRSMTNYLLQGVLGVVK